jgi:FG-GAP repeat/Putative Ig domain/Viral BACON domain
LTAGDGATNDHFGVSVALSGDTMAIGAYRDAIGANTDQGSVYVFVHPPCPALTIAPASLPNGSLGAPYNQQFTVSNDDDAELNVTVSKGELPPGLTLDNNTGQLSGAPTATGTYRFTITITFYLSGCGASRDYALTITAPLCGALTLNPVSQTFSSRASTGSVQVKAGAGCAWTATSNASWLTITRGANGTGSGQIVYRVAPNMGAARQTVVTVAGQKHLVQQDAAGIPPRLSERNERTVETRGDNQAPDRHFQ